MIHTGNKKPNLFVEFYSQQLYHVLMANTGKVNATMMSIGGRGNNLFYFLSFLSETSECAVLLNKSCPQEKLLANIQLQPPTVILSHLGCVNKTKKHW